MSCYYMRQYIQLAITQPGTAWRSDIILDTPELVSPLDGDSICAEEFDLEWEEVSGADYYIVQWCRSSAFTGPTMRSRKTAGTSVTLDLDDVPLETKVYWRVFAYSTTGGVSLKSEAWEVSKTCPNNPGSPDGSPLDFDFTKCTETGVKMIVDGPKWVMCCDLAMWHLQMSWAHLDGSGNPVLRLDNVTWTVVQNPNDPHNDIQQQTEKFCTVRVNCKASQVFKLRVQAFFTDMRDMTSFACTEEVKVFVDCQTGLPQYKPWLQLNYGDGIVHYIHPDYWDTSLREQQFDGVDMVAVYGADPTTIQSTHTAGNGPTALAPAQWGQYPHKRAVAFGPVAMTGMEPIPRPDMVAGTRCRPNVGPTQGEKVEARVHIPLGCGLRIDERRLAVDLDDLIGSGSERRGLMNISGCKIGAYLGCGLGFDGDGQIKINPTDLVGYGLESGGECGLAVKAGRGILVDSSGVSVYYGCGLSLDESGRIGFDAESVAGYGLRTTGGCELAVSLAECGGLGFNGDGELLVETDSSVLSRTIWSLDPSSVVLSVSGCSVSLYMVVIPYSFYTNCGNVLTGPVVVGDPVTINQSVSLYYCCTEYGV